MRHAGAAQDAGHDGARPGATRAGTTSTGATSTGTTGSGAREEQPEGDLLAVSDVSVAFGGLQALDTVSLDVGRRQVLGLIGPNGAGKTTLFNVICGFVRPNSGSLHWEGRPLKQVRPQHLARLGIARTLQSLGLFPHLSALENVMVGADRHHRAGFATALGALPKSDTDERSLGARASGLMDELGVADAGHLLPGQLPYGVQKRVALARALVAEPKLLLLDEPASGLSEAEMRELGGLVRTLRERTSVMLVEHHMDLVMSVCDRLVVLDFGKVIAHGTPSEVQGDQAVIDAYLGEAVPDGHEAGNGHKPPGTREPSDPPGAVRAEGPSGSEGNRG